MKNGKYTRNKVLSYNFIYNDFINNKVLSSTTSTTKSKSAKHLNSETTVTTTSKQETMFISTTASTKTTTPATRFYPRTSFSTTTSPVTGFNRTINSTMTTTTARRFILQPHLKRKINQQQAFILKLFKQ